MKSTTEEKREAIPNSVSRMLLAGIGVLLQVLWIFWLALKLNDYSTAIQVCTSALTFLITLRIYGLHINSAYKISWIILILLFPIFGLTIYLLFGRSGAVSVMQADQFAGRGTRGPVVHEGGLCGHGGGLQQVTQGQTATELPLQLPEQLESGEGVPTAQEEAVRHAHVVHPEDVFPDGGHGLFRPGPGGDARTGALPYGTA